MIATNRTKKLVGRVVLALIVAMMPLLPTFTLAADTSLQAYLNGQHYNNLISDSDFLDINSMSAQDIQNFLVSRGSYLASAPSSQLGDGAAGRNAAQIIYDAAHGLYDAAVGCANGVCINSSTGTISPKAILITLQKEMSLVTLSTYDQGRLDRAMGYGCPDSGGCDARYLGFSNQVGWAAWQLRYNCMAPESRVSPYYVGRVTSIADWDGTRSVYFSNRATASLFRYTPHTYYGNYNFWRLGIEWFGFGIGSGGGGEGVNDTSSASARMYANHGAYLIKSLKQSGTRVYFSGQLVADIGPTSWQYQFNPAIGTHNYSFEYRDGSGGLVGTKVITVEKRKNGDINGDGSVNLLDLSLIGGSWGETVKDDNWTNLNPDVDNEINLLDISIFANNWEG